MKTEPKSMCRKCLTTDMDERQYFENLHSYIANLDDDIKVRPLLYDERIAICKGCNLLADGMCRACGCYVELRAAMRTKSCPYGRWKAEKTMS